MFVETVFGWNVTSENISKKNTKKKNDKRREDFIKLKSENCSSKATADVSDEIPKANNNDNYDVFEWGED